ncbi:peptide receptor GPCR [Elysia marginata]|uniref:Peptide receptor GPCR n=1 Tax=Elysia marginata TaxID=1093978 RepID=A0AAV4H925_9GAST|nr:peptide receptor GPCR [Elysia marginata]
MEHHEESAVSHHGHHEVHHGHHDGHHAESLIMANDSDSHHHHAAHHTYVFGPDARHKFELVFNLVLTFSFSVTGVLTNIANMIVFAKNGFSETTNINFFALSVSDLLIVVWFLIKNLCENPLLVHSSPLFVTLRDFFIITIPIYHAVQGYGAWVTAFITVERTVCIVYPLKVRSIFTPTRVTIVLMVVLMFELGSLVPPYATMELVWVVSPMTNVSKLRHADHHAHHGVLSYLVFYTVPSLISFTIVTVGTGVLVVKLRQTMRWRESAAQTSGKDVSQKEAKVAQSVVLVCVMFVICYSPCVYIIIKGTIDPHFHFGDPYYQNFIFSYLSVTFFLQSISSSMNMFVYINLSSKYKETFMQVFCSGKVPQGDTK